MQIFVDELQLLDERRIDPPVRHRLGDGKVGGNERAVGINYGLAVDVYLDLGDRRAICLHDRRRQIAGDIRRRARSAVRGTQERRGACCYYGYYLSAHVHPR